MKKTKKIEFTEKFKKEMIERKQMSFLVGGDGDGGQGSTDDPWL
jgi:natural product precursor